jgi:hypothetical protein
VTGQRLVYLSVANASLASMFWLNAAPSPDVSLSYHLALHALWPARCVHKSDTKRRRKLCATSTQAHWQKVGWLIDGLQCCPAVGLLVCWVSGLLDVADWLGGWLAGWAGLAGLLAGGLCGWLAGLLAD